MNVKFFLLYCLVLFTIQLNATILCPADKYLTCHDDIHYLPLVGVPTVLSGSGQLRYSDQSPNNVCNVGHIIRTWYLDNNGNQAYDSGEYSCLQNIYVSYTPGTTTIDWPADIVLNCTDDIPDTNPTWVSGPCDIIGVSRYDQVFGTDTKSCFKILRHFTVVNWCTHVPGSNEGIWTHTQVIKIDDATRPVIKNCALVTLGTNVGCQATFNLSNSATDLSPCGQQRLLWKAEVDLWADGSIEYTFAHNHPDTLFRMDTVTSGKTVTIKLPYPVNRGYHKVTWRVHDQCGNAAVCEQKVWVKDNEKPTPYIHEILSASFEGKDHPLKVRARMFNVGSFDNCTKSNQLRYSFSPNVNDTIKTITCNNAGFQFFTIYVTDLDGNQQFADAFMLVFDNGACSNTLRMVGKVTESNNLPLPDVLFQLKSNIDPSMDRMAYSDQQGNFTWDNISLYDQMEIEPSYAASQERRLDIADLKMLQDYIMGKWHLTDLQYLAADLDGDSNIKIKDLDLLKKRILSPELYRGDHWTFAAELDTIQSETKLKTIKKNLLLSQTNGTLAFKAVYLGDITDANEKLTGIRSTTLVNEVLNDKQIIYTLNESLEAEALQIFIQLPLGVDEVNLHSDYFDIPYHAMTISEDGILRFVVTKPMNFSSGDVLFTLGGDFMSENSSLPEWLADSKVLVKQYATRDLKIARNRSEVFIYPNPTTNTFNIEGKDLRVLDIKNVAGESIPFIHYGNTVEWHVASGLYFISLLVDNKKVRQKIIKI